MVTRFNGCLSQGAPWGVEKEGGGKPHEGHPVQKGFWTRLGLVRFPPPKSPQLRKLEALLEGFREGVLSGTFSSPHTLCNPPYHGPTFVVAKKNLDWWWLPDVSSLLQWSLDAQAILAQIIGRHRSFVAPQQLLPLAFTLVPHLLLPWLPLSEKQSQVQRTPHLLLATGRS